MNDEKNEVINRLDLIIKLLAISNFSKGDSQKEKILKLYSVNLKPIEIADILGTTSNTVNNTLSRARKEGIIK